MTLFMTAPPPPPPGYSPPKTRPSNVTKYFMYMIITSIILVILGIINMALWPPVGYATGAIALIFAILVLILSFGLFMGQAWALKWSGYANARWAQAPEVREYFKLPPAQPAYATPAPTTAPPPAPTCPTCGSTLRYIQQYQRWYCDKEQKYV
jgi:hypothetical protein